MKSPPLAIVAAFTAASSIEQQIPLMLRCVDLSASGAAAACRSVGFFRVTNHGVAARIADALEARATAFFALPAQDKLDMSGAARPLGYGSKTIGYQ